MLMLFSNIKIHPDLGQAKLSNKVKKKAYGSHDEREQKLQKESSKNHEPNLIRNQTFNVLSTQGDTSSNGTGVGDRRSSGGKKLKSSSNSCGSNERKSIK